MPNPKISPKSTRKQSPYGRIRVSLIAHPGLPASTRVLLFLSEFARAEDRRVKVSRRILAEAITGLPATPQSVDLVKKALHSLRQHGLIEVVDAPTSRHGAYDYMCVYQLIDEGADYTLTLETMNKYSKMKEYVRPEDYSYTPESSEPAPKQKPSKIPDIPVPLALTTHPTFRSLFQGTEDARRSWASISKAADGQEMPLRLMLEAMAIHFRGGQSKYGKKPVTNPGAWMVHTIKQMRSHEDIAASGIHQDFVTALTTALTHKKHEATPGHGTHASLRDMIIGGQTAAEATITPQAAPKPQHSPVQPVAAPHSPSTVPLQVQTFDFDPHEEAPEPTPPKKVQAVAAPSPSLPSYASAEPDWDGSGDFWIQMAGEDAVDEDMWS